MQFDTKRQSGRERVIIRDIKTDKRVSAVLAKHRSRRFERDNLVEGKLEGQKDRRKRKGKGEMKKREGGERNKRKRKQAKTEEQERRYYKTFSPLTKCKQIE